MPTNDNAIANAQCERTLRLGFVNAKGIQREKLEHEGTTIALKFCSVKKTDYLLLFKSVVYFLH